MQYTYRGLLASIYNHQWKISISAVLDPSLLLWPGILRAYMILVQVNDLSADNLKIVHYETKSNFETTENIYYLFNILNYFFLFSFGAVI